MGNISAQRFVHNILVNGEKLQVTSRANELLTVKATSKQNTKSLEVVIIKTI